MISFNILSNITYWKQRQGDQITLLQCHLDKFLKPWALESENPGTNSDSLIDCITLGQVFNSIKVSVSSHQKY